MIFEYDELKEAVTEDFEQFYQMGFSETQIFPAVLDEYKHGQDFCLTENVCIHIFLALNYAENGLNFHTIVEELHNFITEEVMQEIQVTLGDEAEKYNADFKMLMKKAQLGTKK